MANSTVENLTDISGAGGITSGDLFYVFRPGAPDADYKADTTALDTYVISKFVSNTGDTISGQLDIDVTDATTSSTTYSEVASPLYSVLTWAPAADSTGVRFANVGFATHSTANSITSNGHYGGVLGYAAKNNATGTDALIIGVEGRVGALAGAVTSAAAVTATFDTDTENAGTITIGVGYYLPPQTDHAHISAKFAFFNDNTDWPIRTKSDIQMVKGSYVSSITPTTLTADRTITLPDATGTIMLTSAIGSTVQAYDATLAALASYNTNGILCQTAADTFAGRTLTGGGGVTVTNGTGVSGNPTLGVSALKTAYIPAAAMRPSSSGGCAALALVATAANHPDISSLDFDSTTAEYAQFYFSFPKGWDEGTITAIFYWSHAATATNFGVRWGLQAVACSDDDTLDVAYGSAQEVTDTGGTTSDLYVSAATSAITIAGTPAAGDLISFRVYRDPANAADTMAIDARLMGVKILYTIDTLDDT